MHAGYTVGLGFKAWVGREVSKRMARTGGSRLASKAPRSDIGDQTLSFFPGHLGLVVGLNCSSIFVTVIRTPSFLPLSEDKKIPSW